jgi:CelD/BcsL family acetyltransferase involved in cellulose biosynthesis
MAQAVPARLDAHFGVGDAPVVHDAPALSPAAVTGDIRLTVYENLSAIEQDWRAFEPHADCTVFQSFDWLATWQRLIGARNGVQPAIVVGRDASGSILFVLPLAVRSAGFARKLTWLGTELCDYNAPLLSAAFSARIDAKRFMALWENIAKCLQDNTRLHFDFIDLEKMPETVGAQQNPMRHLGGTITPSGAYLTHLAGDWETFYAAKRSSSTRRRDRTKRKKLAEFGELKLINPDGDREILHTLDTLMAQKTRSFSRMGVGNLFAKPGYAEFYRALATDPATRHLVHVSRLDVGATAAAVNLGLTYRDCYYHLLASYDDGDVSRFGPGAAHLQELLHQAIDRGFRIFDFTIGDEGYKRDWCDTEIKLYDYVSAATWRGALVAMPMLAARRLKRWIKQTPMLWSAFSAGRALIGSMARGFRR